MGSLFAGAIYTGEFAQRLKAVVEEVTASNGQTILFIDEIHTLLGAGRWPFISKPCLSVFANVLLLLG